MNVVFCLCLRDVTTGACVCVCGAVLDREVPVQVIVIVGCVCGAVVVTLVIVLVVLLCRRHEMKRKPCDLALSLCMTSTFNVGLVSYFTFITITYKTLRRIWPERETKSKLNVGLRGT